MDPRGDQVTSTYFDNDDEEGYDNEDDVDDGDYNDNSC